MSLDFYILLGIAEGASGGDVKKAYRRLARRYHPDINPGDRAAEERFRRISYAYEVLSDPDKRVFYDENGYYSEGVLDEPTEARWNFSFRGFSAGGTETSDTSGFGELFENFFNQERPRQGADTGGDIEGQVSLTFEESIRGAGALVHVQQRQQCPSCDGTGRESATLVASCRECDGSGQLIKAKGHLRFSMTCPRCQGSGRVVLACRACRGRGTAARGERVRIDIPAGVSTGSRIRFPGQGDAGSPGRPPGDLYVVTNVAPHAFFSRVGDNIHCSVPVTLTEAALGARIEVPTVNGRATVKVPPGTESGRKLRLRGRGAPSLRGEGVRGDQYVEVKVVVPRVVDERSREILKELAELNPEDPRKDLEAYGR